MRLCNRGKTASRYLRPGVTVKSLDQIRKSTWLLSKAEEKAAKGATDDGAAAAAASSAGGAKAPKGFSPIPKSQRGGYRKRLGNGGYVYWYPDGKGGKGKVTTKHTEKMSGMDMLLIALEAALPPDKKPLLVDLKAMLEDGTDPSGETAANEAEAAAGKGEAGAADEPAPIPPELEELHADHQETSDALRTEVQRHELERKRAEMQTALDMLQELAPGITEDKVAKIQAAVTKRFGVPIEEEPELAAKSFADVAADIVKSVKKKNQPSGAPGGGRWMKIPKGRRGGYRRRTRGGWEYWYPKKETQQTEPKRPGKQPEPERTLVHRVERRSERPRYLRAGA